METGDQTAWFMTITIIAYNRLLFNATLLIQCDENVNKKQAKNFQTRRLIKQVNSDAPKSSLRDRKHFGENVRWGKTWVLNHMYNTAGKKSGRQNTKL